MEIIFENLVQCHATVFKHPTQYYVIYINNLSNTQHEAIVDVLSHRNFFVGYADMTFSSRLKTLLAYSLVNLGIKHQDTMILQHEADREDQENINNCGYSFESSGFSVKSINDMYFGLFSIIKDCILKSYFYNLEYLEEYNVAKFNVSLELRTTQGKMRKVLAALKYSPVNNTLELITMY